MHGELLGVCFGTARTVRSTTEVTQLTLAGTQPARLAGSAPPLPPARLGPRGAASQKALVPVTWGVTSHRDKCALKLSQLGGELGTGCAQPPGWGQG